MMKEQEIKQKGKIKLRLVVLLLLIALVSMILLSKMVMPANISFGADDNVMLIEANLDKYVNYHLSEEDKGTLVQYGVQTKIDYGEDKEFSPIKQSEVMFQFNRIDEKYPYDVKVITQSTEVTNGKTENFENNYEYNKDTGTIIIKVDNQNEEGEAIYKEKPNEGATDQYKIIGYYDAYIDGNTQRDLSVQVKAKSMLFTQNNEVIQGLKILEVNATDKISDITSIDYKTDEIYNGYIKSNKINNTNYATTYKETEEITISKKEAQEKLELLENNTFFKVENKKGKEQINDLGNNNNLVYKSTKIFKKDIINILGENGTLEILDKERNRIAIIDQNTQWEEDGTTTVVYNTEPQELIFKTSDIQKEGIITLEHTKEIRNVDENILNAKISTKTHIAGIKTEATQPTVEEKTTYEENLENTIEIQDSKTDINMEVNTLEWTNEKPNEVTFKVYLNSNTIKDNMFHNPTLRIQLPSQVEKVILGDSYIFYDNGLKLQDPYTETDENGNITIVANISRNANSLC